LGVPRGVWVRDPEGVAVAVEVDVDVDAEVDADADATATLIPPTPRTSSKLDARPATPLPDPEAEGPADPEPDALAADLDVDADLFNVLAFPRPPLLVAPTPASTPEVEADEDEGPGGDDGIVTVREDEAEVLLEDDVVIAGGGVTICASTSRGRMGCEDVDAGTGADVVAFVLFDGEADVDNDDDNRISTSPDKLPPTSSRTLTSQLDPPTLVPVLVLVLESSQDPPSQEDENDEEEAEGERVVSLSANCPESSSSV